MKPFTISREREMEREKEMKKKCRDNYFSTKRGPTKSSITERPEERSRSRHTREFKILKIDSKKYTIKYNKFIFNENFYILVVDFRTIQS